MAESVREEPLDVIAGRVRLRDGPAVVVGADVAEQQVGACPAAALIIGHRSESTDEKTSLNDALRTFEVPV